MTTAGPGHGTTPIGESPNSTEARRVTRTDRGRGLKSLWQTAAREPIVVLSCGIVAIVLVMAFFPAIFAIADPFEVSPALRLSPPSVDHWFGTDHLGRDTYSRVVYGTALSLQATIIAVLIALLVGSFLGLVAGFFGGWVDAVTMRLIDVLQAIPSLLLSLTVVAMLGQGTTNIAIAVGLASVASFARLMRSEVLRTRQEVFVEAATASGAKTRTILRRHVLPNSSGSVIALSALEFGQAILAVTALSFLGFGAPPPAPEWGSLMSEGRDYLRTAWWLTTLPGLFVVLVVLATNRISRWLGMSQRART